jgi:predicted RNA-binding Zn-ribbon protein involved in translation (DUF1610 family)
MPEKPTVIYVAGSFQQAHLLKDLLAGMGIRAMVENDVLQGGSGVDVLGWATSARVVVAEEDAPRARDIALQFDRPAATAGESPEIEESEQNEQTQQDESAAQPQEPFPWPTCPRCGQRRTTRCPVCGTVGSDFPAADLDFSGPLGLDAARSAPACGCGPGGCTPAAPQEPDEPAGAILPLPGATQAMLLCPTCDEPFVPDYPRRCVWCGEQFPSGYEVDPADQAEVYEEGVNVRVVVVLGAIVLLLAVIAGWLLFVLG